MKEFNSIVDYTKNHFNLSDYYDHKQENIKMFQYFHNKDFKRLRLLFEINLRYLLPFIWVDDLIGLDDNTRVRIIMNCNNATFSLFESIIELLPSGNYVPVRTIQRQIFEFIIISSHLVMNDDKYYIRNWLEHKDVKIVKQLLKRIKHPNIFPLIQFWVGLSNNNHASDITSQPDLNWSWNGGYIKENIVLTFILLKIYNIHLRQRYFPFMNKFISEEFNETRKCPFKSDKFAEKELFKTKTTLEFTSLIDAFSFNWRVK